MNETVLRDPSGSNPEHMPLTRRAAALVLLALAAGSFGIGTGEFAIMGRSRPTSPLASTYRSRRLDI